MSGRADTTTASSGVGARNELAALAWDDDNAESTSIPCLTKRSTSHTRRLRDARCSTDTCRLGSEQCVAPPRWPSINWDRSRHSASMVAASTCWSNTCRRRSLLRWLTARNSAERPLPCNVTPWQSDEVHCNRACPPVQSRRRVLLRTESRLNEAPWDKSVKSTASASRVWPCPCRSTASCSGVTPSC